MAIKLTNVLLPDFAGPTTSTMNEPFSYSLERFSALVSWAMTGAIWPMVLLYSPVRRVISRLTMALLLSNLFSSCVMVKEVKG